MDQIPKNNRKKTVLTGAAALGAGPGRPKGIPNKATTEFRHTVKQLLEDNRENVSIWLQAVANGKGHKEPAPDRALELLAKLAEYAVPKLARTEIVGDPSQPMTTVIKWSE